MTRLSKTVVKLFYHGTLLMLLITAGAISPATALDLNGGGPAEFCATLDQRTDRVDTQLRKAQNAVHAAWSQQTDRLRVMNGEQRSSRTELDTTIDVQRAHNLSELRHSATTSSGRLAVDAYKNTQAQAGAVRRRVVSQADDTFTAAVKRLVADRQATQAGQVEALRITLDDALQTASGQCAAGADPATISQDFVASVHTSRDTYLAQRKADTAIGAQVSSLSDIRRQATATANQKYKNVMSQARRTLQTSLESSD
jgi:F0F1-type ATP synthase membrane subunit b/b'